MATKLIEETEEKDSVSEDMMNEYKEIDGDTPGIKEAKGEEPEVPVEGEVKEDASVEEVEDEKLEASVGEEKMREYKEIVKKQNKMVSNLPEGQRKGVKKLRVNDLVALDKLEEEYGKAKEKGNGETQKELGYELYEFGRKFKYWVWDV